MDDKNLVGCFQRGDQGAFAELVRRHEPRLLRVCLRITKDAEDAQDALQECWVKAMAGLARFDGRSQVGTWLYSIATNAALDQRRSRERRPDPIGVGELEHLLPPLPGPAEQTIDREYCRALLVKLSPAKRRALVLHVAVGLSYREVADLEGVPLTTVQTRILRARRALSARPEARPKARPEARPGEVRVVLFDGRHPMPSSAAK
ncbi:RNA polymerase sigma factor [Actinomadura chibensis]|nr:RNA polymerase sigma factor [Actinomadura chibensis]